MPKSYRAVGKTGRGEQPASAVKCQAGDQTVLAHEARRLLSGARVKDKNLPGIAHGDKARLFRERAKSRNPFQLEGTKCRALGKIKHAQQAAGALDAITCQVGPVRT